MPNVNTCWFESKKFAEGDTMKLTEALDLGECNTIEVVVSVETADAGADGVLVLEHAARNMSDAYLDFEVAQTVALTEVGKTWVKIDRITRFLGWSLSGTLDGGAVVTADVVGKR